LENGEFTLSLPAKGAVKTMEKRTNKKADPWGKTRTRWTCPGQLGFRGNEEMTRESPKRSCPGKGQNFLEAERKGSGYE